MRNPCLALVFLGLLVFLPAGAQADQAQAALATGNVTQLKAELAKDPGLLTRKDEEGKQLIHMAAWWGKVPVLELLLEEGADINAKADKTGLTPVDYASSMKRNKAVEFLRAQGGKSSRD